ncbi:PH domain-containing protein [Macrococcus armenti]|uniref:PH domain-containing protein n=1 Tax=Macrococcus armenti TaxID=2875764 RepID=UPI001CCB2FF3|nr:PH domain-containing protein [Macrococcus armenti]UBH07725.1 PH domain-containing protein [Macrococcus armenti]UBH09960.1 PH domain-containing protein [Macrococcus armenti]UBH14509.1 PH domain-containing protein [Macrococcus armenti]UBH16869.1 PH domain-containing protein [Macrococcus armenti]UBH19132.1 PH domain-containing protein [Macrococcus armenti]
MRYKSIVNSFQKLMLIIIIVLVSIAFYLNPVTSGVASLLLGSLLLFTLFREYYDIERNVLFITKGFERKAVNIRDIEIINLVKVGDNILVELYGNEQKVVVKPKLTLEFIAHLKKVNPDIQIQNFNLADTMLNTA